VEHERRLLGKFALRDRASERLHGSGGRNQDEDRGEVPQHSGMPSAREFYEFRRFFWEIACTKTKFSSASSAARSSSSSRSYVKAAGLPAP
jgi:hypothetical protein